MHYVAVALTIYFGLWYLIAQSRRQSQMEVFIERTYNILAEAEEKVRAREEYERCLNERR